MFYPRLRKAVEANDIESVKDIFEANKEDLKECEYEQLHKIPHATSLDMFKLYQEYIPQYPCLDIDTLLKSSSVNDNEDMINKLLDVGYEFDTSIIDLFFLMTPVSRQLVLDNLFKNPEKFLGRDLFKLMDECYDYSHCVKYLIEKHHFDINYRDADKQHLTLCAYHEVHLIKKFVDCGADITAKDRAGCNIIDHLRKSHPNKLKHLLELLELDALRSEVEELREKTNELDALHAEVEELREKTNELDALHAEIEELKKKLAEKAEPTSEPVPDQSQEFDYMFYDNKTCSIWYNNNKGAISIGYEPLECNDKLALTHINISEIFKYVKDELYEFNRKLAIKTLQTGSHIHYDFNLTPKIEQFYAECIEFLTRTEPISN